MQWRVERHSSLRELRGATLLEVVVGVLIFSTLILGLALTLFSEAGSRIRTSGLRAGDLTAGRVIDRIRTDVWGSSSIVVPFNVEPMEGGWYEVPLVISGHWSGYRMAYGVEGGVLRRATFLPGDDPEDADAIRNVERFRWRFLRGGSRTSVEVVIIHTETPTFRGPDGAAASRTVLTEHVVATPRRVQATSW